MKITKSKLKQVIREVLKEACAASGTPCRWVSAARHSKSSEICII